MNTNYNNTDHTNTNNAAARHPDQSGPDRRHGDGSGTPELLCQGGQSGQGHGQGDEVSEEGPDP